MALKRLGQRKGRGGGADGAGFAHKAVDDAARIAAAEKIGERGVFGTRGP